LQLLNVDSVFTLIHFNLGQVINSIRSVQHIEANVACKQHQCNYRTKSDGTSS